MKYNMLGDANYAGPVRLSDTYDSEVGDASTGIAASQKALYDAYNSLNSRLFLQKKSLSLVSGHFGTVYTNRTYRIGNIVFVHLLVRVTTGFKSGDTFATLPYPNIDGRVDFSVELLHGDGISDLYCPPNRNYLTVNGNDIGVIDAFTKGWYITN